MDLSFLTRVTIFELLKSYRCGFCIEPVPALSEWRLVELFKLKFADDPKLSFGWGSPTASFPTSSFATYSFPTSNFSYF